MDSILKNSVVLGFCIALSACGGSSSDDDVIVGIDAYIDAEATGDGNTTVSARLFKGRAQVDVNLGDLMVTANFGGGGAATETMEPTVSQLLQQQHSASFADDDPATVFDIAYTSMSDTAPSSTVSVPMGFAIDPPPAMVSFSDPELVVSWVNDDLAYAGGATLTLTYRVDSCSGDFLSLPFPVSLTLSDAETTYSLPMSAIKTLVPGYDTATECSLVIELKREQSGSLDPAYVGGSITGRQTRSETFTIVP